MLNRYLGASSVVDFGFNVSTSIDAVVRLIESEIETS